MTPPPRRTQTLLLASVAVALLVLRSAVFAELVVQPILPEGPLTLAGTRTLNLGAFSIMIVPGPGLAGNMAAFAAFNRAAAQ